MKKTNKSSALHGENRGVLRRVKSLVDRNRLGELLVLNGALTPRQLRFALAEQRNAGTSLGKTLLQRRLIHRHQLYHALAQQTAFRMLAAVMTLMLVIAALGIKPAKAAGIKDVPAQISLVSIANSAFSPVSSYPALFGSEERRSSNLRPFTKWTQMFDRFDQAIKTASGRNTMESLKRDLESMQGLPLHRMAEQVNSMINDVSYIQDSDNWGRSDYWATPVEFMAKGGDCEDYAIAKYTALRMLGVPEERMRIAIVHDLQKDIPHAVLIVYTDEGSMILDNQTKDARLTSNVSRYRPIFSINRHAWWLHTKPGASSPETVIASAQ